MATQQVRGTHSWERRGIFLTLACILCAGFMFALAYLADAGDKRASEAQKDRAAAAPSLKGLPATDLAEDEAIVHALNRLGYGPRPGELQRVKDVGLAKWIDRQLHPESINDSGMEARLSRFTTLSMSSEALLVRFPRPAVAAKREGVSPQEYRKEQQERLQAARQAADGQQGSNTQPEQMPEQSLAPPYDDSRQGESARPNSTSRSPRASSPQTMAPDELAEILLPGAKDFKNQNGAGNSAANPGGNPLMNFEQLQTPQRVIAELAMAKMDRAVYSEKQLYEQ